MHATQKTAAPRRSQLRTSAYVTFVELYVAATYHGDRCTSNRQYLNHDIATHAVREGGGWEGDGTVEYQRIDVVVYKDEAGREVMRELGRVVTLDFVDYDEIRARALMKLTPEEMLALGLRPEAVQCGTNAG